MGSRQAGSGRGMFLALAVVQLMMGVATPSVGLCSDIFNTHAELPIGPAAPVFGTDAEACAHRPITSPLPLFEAIERALCESPKTRSAWASVKAAAANVGEIKSSYLPALNASIDYSYQHESGLPVTAGIAQPSPDTEVASQSLSLTWLLFDFGGRSASLRNSKQLLAAAQATQNSTLQTALANTARDYYAAQAAAALVQSAEQIEADTRQILDAATARFATGVAPITDKLQAAVAYDQAVYQRAAAQGSFRIALGTLAVDMNLAPDEPLRLPDLDQGALPDLGFVSGVHQLIDEATRTHPTVLAAKAQWEAALDNIGIVRAQGLPRVQISSDVSHSNQPLTTGLGVASSLAPSRQASIGLSISIPLFEGFGRQYKIRQAEAIADQQALALRDTEELVALGVWSSFQILQTDTENLRNTAALVDSARQAFDASDQRYKHGVGGILELLSGANALANSEQQRIQAQSDWRGARLQLAESLGQLGMWAVR